MQISSQSLLPSLTAQIAASVAQAAEQIGSTISDGGTSGPAATAGATPTSAPSVNSSAASTLSSNTLGALIQQTQTDQEPGEPPPLVGNGWAVGKNLGLQTSGPLAGWNVTDYGTYYELQPNSQAQSLVNSIDAASSEGNELNQLNLETDAVYATQNSANSPSADLKRLQAALAGSDITLTQAQVNATESWATSNSVQTQT